MSKCHWVLFGSFGHQKDSAWFDDSISNAACNYEEIKVLLQKQKTGNSLEGNACPVLFVLHLNPKILIQLAGEMLQGQKTLVEGRVSLFPALRHRGYLCLSSSTKRSKKGKCLQCRAVSFMRLFCFHFSPWTWWMVRADSRLRSSGFSSTSRKWTLQPATWCPFTCWVSGYGGKPYSGVCGSTQGRGWVSWFLYWY